MSATTISNWKKRNTIDYERLFTKCENINFDWLFMGRGEMHRNNYSLTDNAPPGVNEGSADYYRSIIKAKEETIGTQKRYITHLESELKKFHVEEPAEDGQKRKVG